MSEAVEKAELQMLFALFVEHHKSASAFAELGDLYDEYGMTFPKEWVASSISPWEDRDWLKVWRSYDGTAALVLEKHYTSVLKKILESFNGLTLSIHADQREIVADFDVPSDWPLPEGWKWLSTVPAADRIVRLDHNSAPYQQAVQSLSKLSDTLATTNDIGELTSEESAVAQREIKALSLEIQGEAVRRATFFQRAKDTLSWVSEQAAGAVVGHLALACLAAIAALLGFVI